MWLLFGGVAVIATFINLYFYKAGKNYHLPMAVGLSFTALTLATNYSMVSSLINVGDWAALADVVPTMSIVFWILTVLSILLNTMPVFLELMKKSK